MSVLLSRYNICYFPVPKVACTSLKRVFFYLENGFPFRPFHANGRLVHIHDSSIYPTLNFKNNPYASKGDFLRVALVRDPLRRFLSAYSNKVVHHKKLSAKMLFDAKSELPADPDLDEFIANFFAYQKDSAPLMHHTVPMVEFIGRDPGLYDQIFNFQQIEEFGKWLGARTSTELTIPKLQTGGPKLEVSLLTDAQKEFLTNYYSEDYEIYGDYLEKL